LSEETVSEMSYFYYMSPQLIAWEEFISFSCYENHSFCRACSCFWQSDWGIRKNYIFWYRN